MLPPKAAGRGISRPGPSSSSSSSSCPSASPLPVLLPSPSASSSSTCLHGVSVESVVAALPKAEAAEEEAAEEAVEFSPLESLPIMKYRQQIVNHINAHPVTCVHVIQRHRGE
eukprot:GHVT01012362.1.p2 GENE.GHVT01012362.1~~GHVT01012362.1.p2  ORF type:complete len:113 (+),score=49.00 GHVT01012362.1:182-520(+)